MGRMTTAVCCVFCILCAAHVHCAELKKQRWKRSIDDQMFVKRLFSVFGEGDTMTLEGFERMLKTVGLERLVSPVASVHVIDNVSPPTISNVASNRQETNGKVWSYNSVTCWLLSPCQS